MKTNNVFNILSGDGDHRPYRAEAKGCSAVYRASSPYRAIRSEFSTAQR